MRCTWKVASRGDVMYPKRGECHYSQKDDRAVSAWANEVVSGWDSYIAGEAKEQADSISARQHRDVERAMRYDSWGYVRYEVLGRLDKSGKYYIENRVTVSVPNTEDEAVVGSCNEVAKSIARIVVAKHRSIDDATLKSRIRWERNPFFDKAEEEWRD